MTAPIIPSEFADLDSQANDGDFKLFLKGYEPWYPHSMTRRAEHRLWGSVIQRGGERRMLAVGTGMNSNGATMRIIRDEQGARVRC